MEVFEDLLYGNVSTCRQMSLPNFVKDMAECGPWYCVLWVGDIRCAVRALQFWDSVLGSLEGEQ
ncbi:hypothetical protein SAY86_027196 [Trapa natans]|uniref:Uncharacterized protein n=1 Tax=Trapa natans TaxID=22666 RepID=A0AAN7KKX5_TRANT|nr:hypothetical protein SAY86_027196 [Trapa natans]